MKTDHTPTRCKDCLWVHEADSIKRTSFQGVQLCSLHDRAVNSHEELLGLVIKFRLLLEELPKDGPYIDKHLKLCDDAIAKAEDKPS